MRQLKSELFLRSVVAGLVLLLLASAPVPASDAITARAAIFSNSTRAIRYYGKNINMKVLPASTAKVMTALLVLDHLSLNDVVTVSPEATNVQPSKINARAGERYRVSDLLYALLMNSANDVSIVLAEAVAGSEWKFVEMMNARAQQLGAKNTHFINSHGLPSNQAQYTTPYDMYLIFRAALKNNFFRKVLKLRNKTIYSMSGRKTVLKSHNKILFMNWKRKLYGKTGYTRGAKACFVGYLIKGNDICIIAVFGCTHRWDDIKHIVSQYGGIAL